MSDDECFAQGARCGHLDGKGRAGCYILGEEALLAAEAAKAQGLSEGKAWHWSLGYQYGYLKAASGEELDEKYR